MCSIKKVFLKISQNLQENTCSRISLLITCRPQVLFYRTPPGDCFWNLCNFFSLISETPSAESVLDALSATLPDQIKIDTSLIPCKQRGVFSKSWIKQGTKMGPYTGTLVTVANLQQIEDTTHMWEVKHC